MGRDAVPWSTSELSPAQLAGGAQGLLGASMDGRSVISPDGLKRYVLSETIAASGYDQTKLLQEAADDLFASLGGTSDQTTARNTGFVIRLQDGQEYASEGLAMPTGMSLTSVSGVPLPFSDNASFTGTTPVSSGPVLRHIYTGATIKPLLYNDTSKGITRTGASKFALNTVQGLVLAGKPAACSRRGDAPLLQFVSAFGVNILGNLVFTSAGFGLKVVSCNALNVLYNNFLYAPWFFQGLVDSNAAYNQVGGGHGYASDSVWMTGDKDQGQLTRLCLFACNLFYNNNSNGNFVNQFAHEAGISSVAGTVISLDRNVGGGGDQSTNWIGETPLIFSTIGTLPTVSSGAAIRDGKTYWCQVQANGTSIKLARNRADLATNTFISFSSAGAGCKLRVGGNANLHLNDGTTTNQFMPQRSDQSFGDGILFNDAPMNNFQALLVAFARCSGGNPGGYAAATPGASITLRNNSFGNTIAGIVDGLQHGATGVGPSAAKYAVDADASSRVGLDISGLRPINFSPASTGVANSTAYVQADLNPRRVALPPQVFAALSGTVTLNISLVRRSTLAVSPASSAVTNMVIPTTWASVRVRVRWANATTTAASCQWGAYFGYFAEGDDASALEQLQGSSAAFGTIGGAGDQNKMHETVIELGASDNLLCKQLALRLIRLDASGPVLQVLEVIVEESV